MELCFCCRRLNDYKELKKKIYLSPSSHLFPIIHFLMLISRLYYAEKKFQVFCPQMMCEQISISMNFPIIQNYLAVPAYWLLCLLFAICYLYSAFGHWLCVMFLLLDRKSSKLTKPFWRDCANTLADTLVHAYL